MRQTATDFCLYIIKIWKLYVRELIKNICPSDFSESNWTFIVSTRNLGLLAGEGLPCEPLSLRLPLPPRVVRYIYITCFIYDLRTSCYTLQVPPEEHPDVLDHLPDHGPGHRAIPGRLQVTHCLYNIYHRFTCLCPLLSYCSMLLLSYHQCSVETWLMMECYCMVSK